MATFMKKVARALSRTYYFTKSILVDEIIDEVDIETIGGPGYFFCQLRRNYSHSNYIVLKSKGGEATVWVGLERESAKILVEFIKTNLIDG
jgi:hypothetical protein